MREVAQKTGTTGQNIIHIADFLPPKHSAAYGVAHRSFRFSAERIRGVRRCPYVPDLVLVLCDENLTNSTNLICMIHNVQPVGKGRNR